MGVVQDRLEHDRRTDRACGQSGGPRVGDQRRGRHPQVVSRQREDPDERQRAEGEVTDVGPGRYGWIAQLGQLQGPVQVSGGPADAAQANQPPAAFGPATAGQQDHAGQREQDVLPHAGERRQGGQRGHERVRQLVHDGPHREHAEHSEPEKLKGSRRTSTSGRAPHQDAGPNHAC